MLWDGIKHPRRSLVVPLAPRYHPGAVQVMGLFRGGNHPPYSSMSP